MRQVIAAPAAPATIGSYSPAIQAGQTVYLSGQIGLDPTSMNMVSGGVAKEAVQVFENLQAVAKAAGGSLHDVVKLNVFLMNLADVVVVNELIKQYCQQPFPARTTIQVSALPKGAVIEIDAIMVLHSPTTSL